MHTSQSKTSGRGPHGSTIIIFKELKRFNNNNNHLTHGPPRFLPTRGSSRRGVLPPLRGGNHGPKSILFSPYPAIPPYIVRTPHPGTTDDREHITSQSGSILAPSLGHGYRKLPEGHFRAFRGSAWEMTPGGPQRIILKHFGDQLGKWPQEAPRWSFRSIPRPSEENSPRKHPEGHLAKKT